MTEMPRGMDAAAVDWAKRIPVVQIPCVLVYLAGRLLAEGSPDNHRDHDVPSASVPDKLLTAGEIADHLSLPESWIRGEERAGRIPGVRAGKYVRFKLSDVERALAERKRQIG
jgi:excisionase family DNA binding protein